MVDEDSPEFCPHFADGTPRAQCTRCNGREAQQAAAASEVVHWFPARYDGFLSGCGCWISAGTEIGRRADELLICREHARTNPKET